MLGLFALNHSIWNSHSGVFFVDLGRPFQMSRQSFQASSIRPRMSKALGAEVVQKYYHRCSFLPHICLSIDCNRNYMWCRQGHRVQRIYYWPRDGLSRLRRLVHSRTRAPYLFRVGAHCTRDEQRHPVFPHQWRLEVLLVSGNSMPTGTAILDRVPPSTWKSMASQTLFFSASYPFPSKFEISRKFSVFRNHSLQYFNVLFLFSSHFTHIVCLTTDSLKCNSIQKVSKHFWAENVIKYLISSKKLWIWLAVRCSDCQLCSQFESSRPGGIGWTVASWRLASSISCRLCVD